jgi:hypothetical protein
MPKGIKAGVVAPNKVRVSAWIDAELLDRMKGLAAESNLSISEVCNELVRKAITQSKSQQFWDVTGKQLENRITHEVAKMANRLATLISRGALESAATREFLVRNMERRNEPEMVRQMSDAAWKVAVSRLRSPSKDVAELLTFVNKEESSVEKGV